MLWFSLMRVSGMHLLFATYQFIREMLRQFVVPLSAKSVAFLDCTSPAEAKKVLITKVT